MRPCSTSEPSCASTFTAWFGLIEPEVMRPVIMRPRKGLASSSVPIILNGASSSTVGSGTCLSTRSNSGAMPSSLGPSGE